MKKVILDIIDLNKNKKHFLFITIEKIFILFLLYIMILDSAKVYSGILRINRLDGTNIYANADSTSDQQISELFNDPEAVQRANELYNYIDKNFINYSYWEYESPNTYNGNYVFQATTDKYFFELYNIDVFEGRNFCDGDFENGNNSLVPVIVGYGLKDKYKIGETYTEIDLNTGKQWNFEVVGVLKRNQTYPSLFTMGGDYSLDYRYIRPIDKEALNEFSNIDMALGSKVIFSKDESKVKEIEELSSKYNLFDMNFRSISSNTKSYLKEFINGLYMALSLLVALVIILFILSGSKLSIIIKRDYSNYLIRICCGATIGDIYKSFLGQMVAVDLIAIIPTMIFAYNNTGNIICILLTLIFSLGLNCVIVKRAFRKCSISNLSELIRKGHA